MTESASPWRRLVGLLIGRVLPGLVNLLSLLMLTRALDPAQYGIYAVALSSAMMTGALSFHWLVQGASRYIYVYREERSRFLGAIGTGYCAAALLVILIYLVAALISKSSAAPSYLLIGVGCVIALLVGLFDTLAALAVAELRNAAYAKLVFIKAAITALTIIFVSRYSPQAVSVLCCVVAGLVCAIVLAHSDVRRLLRPKLDLSILRKVSVQGVPLGVHFGLSMSLAFSDRLLVTNLLGAKATGYLAATADVVGQTLIMLMTVVHMTFFPLLIRAWESANYLEIDSRFRMGFRLLVVIGVPSATCCIIFSSNLAYMLMGEQFREAAEPLIPWVVVASLLSAFKLFYADLYFILTGKVFSLIPLSVIMLILSVIGNFLAIPLLGLTGAVLVMVGIQVLGLSVSLSRVKHRFSLPIDWRVIGLTVSVCVTASIIAWPLRLQLGFIVGIIQGLLLVLMCGCSYWLARRFSKQ